MHALVINCTLKPSPQTSNTEALAGAVITALQGYGVEVDIVRAVDLNLKPGV
ncbi:flavodoxin family protein, partial [Streptomyces chartreusis]